MKVLVCGGRNYDDKAHVFATLDAIDQRHRISLVIHGCAKGADTLGRRWAESRGREQRARPADWQTHGLRAGPVRNQEMLEEGPDFVVAFPGGNGTADMVRRARRAGVRVSMADPIFDIIG